MPFPSLTLITLAAIILLLALTRTQELQTSLSINHLAIRTTAACPGAAQTSPTSDHNNWRAAWFAAALAHCRGQQQTARALWQQILAQTGSRLPAIRAALPQDLPMAQYAAARQPQSPDAHFWHGDALRHALSEQPDDQASQSNARPQHAIDAYERGLALRPYQGNAWLFTGRLYEQQEQYTQALHAYKNACRYGDRGKHGCRDAAAIYLQQGQYELAVDYYYRSQRQIPNYHRTLRGLTTALLALNRTGEALPHLRTLAAQGDADAQQKLEELTMDDGR